MEVRTDDRGSGAKVRRISQYVRDQNDTEKVPERCAGIPVKPWHLNIDQHIREAHVAGTTCEERSMRRAHATDSTWTCSRSPPFF